MPVSAGGIDEIAVEELEFLKVLLREVENDKETLEVDQREVYSETLGQRTGARNLNRWVHLSCTENRGWRKGAVLGMRTDLLPPFSFDSCVQKAAAENTAVEENTWTKQLCPADCHVPTAAFKDNTSDPHVVVLRKSSPGLRLLGSRKVMSMFVFPDGNLRQQTTAHLQDGFKRPHSVCMLTSANSNHTSFPDVVQRCRTRRAELRAIDGLKSDMPPSTGLLPYRLEETPIRRTFKSRSKPRPVSMTVLELNKEHRASREEHAMPVSTYTGSLPRPEFRWKLLRNIFETWKARSRCRVHKHSKHRRTRLYPPERRVWLTWGGHHGRQGPQSWSKPARFCPSALPAEGGCTTGLGFEEKSSPSGARLVGFRIEAVVYEASCLRSYFVLIITEVCFNQAARRRFEADYQTMREAPRGDLSVMLKLSLILLMVRGSELCPRQCSCYDASELVDCRSQGFTHIPHSVPHSTWLLDLSENRVSELRSASFIGIWVLRVLLLSQNHIRLVHSQALSSLTFLEKLDLSQNQLRVLPPDFSQGLASLKELKLSHNGLERLEAHSLEELSSLQKLDLSHNHLQAMDVGAFRGLVLLRHLNLSWNQLCVLQSGLLSMQQVLSVLLLSHNNISKIDPEALTPLQTLSILRLEANQLRSLKFKTFVNLQTPSTHLQMSENPWMCDCELHRVFSKILRVKHLHVDDFMNITCHTPPLLAGASLGLMHSQLCMAETATVLVISGTVMVTVVAALVMAERKRKRNKILLEKQGNDPVAWSLGTEKGRKLSHS
ncbi:hypothetical protein DNTS_007567 [Danionella cerebrum]|uniref:LRRNT domain-containing protein n=1 Tax=Danionella cerebrum TaxID=2873325 RepID=A0A553N5B3_9TELE|nr:hypothetical protein DNTS_007567 [Danionella translucida]